MITNTFLVTPRDTVNSFFLFRFINNKSGGKLQIREEYADLVCRKCGKLNEISALDRNIISTSKIRSKKTFVLSSDDFYLTNQNGVLSLIKIFGNLLIFQEISGTDYFAVTPKCIVQPKLHDEGFNFVYGTQGNCTECGRPKEVVWSKTPPTISKMPVLFGVNLESQLGARVVWIVQNEVQDELRSLKLIHPGIVYRPIKFDCNVL